MTLISKQKLLRPRIKEKSVRSLIVDLLFIQDFGRLILTDGMARILSLIKFIFGIIVSVFYPATLDPREEECF